MSIYIPANTFAGLCLFGRQRSCLRRYADMCLVRGRHFFLEARRRLPAGSTLASQTRALLLARSRLPDVHCALCHACAMLTAVPVSRWPLT